MPELITSCEERDKELEALSHSLAQSYEELALLHQISDRMTVTQEPEEFFHALCQDLKEVLEVSKLLVLWNVQDAPENSFAKVISSGEPELSKTDTQLLWQRILRQAGQPCKILIDSNVDGPYRHQWPTLIRNLAGVPICRGEKIMGALIALNKMHKADFDSLDTKLLMSVANESAVYLDNFRLYKDLQNLLLGVLRALTSSIDAKDPYTCGHSERVALISRWLANQLSLRDIEVHNMYLAGLLHDVGKIGVSESVLRKPGELMAQEFEQISKHPRIGANILGSIKQMNEVTPAVLTHHEHFNGSGYPQGLRGQNIPLGGRIVMLADSFDAMTSDRTYRKALPHPIALAEIRRFSGTQFDPHLAEIFLNSDLDDLIEQLKTAKDKQHTAGIAYDQIVN
jgi:HD-GYP domain-containing protein (c-di-GMP phosphodiesterase class II)